MTYYFTLIPYGYWHPFFQTVDKIQHQICYLSSGKNWTSIRKLIQQWRNKHVVEEYSYGAIKTEVTLCAWVTLKHLGF